MTIKTTVTTDADTTINDTFDLFSMDMHGAWFDNALAEIRGVESRGGFPYGSNITEFIEKIALGILHPDPGRVEILKTRTSALRPRRAGLVKLGHMTKDHLDAIDLVLGRYAIDAIASSNSPFLGLDYEAAADLIFDRYGSTTPWIYRFEWSRSYPRYIYRTSFILNEGHAEALSYEYAPLYFRYSEYGGSYISFDAEDEAEAMTTLVTHFAGDEECLVYLCDEAAYMYADDSAYNMLVAEFSPQDGHLAGEVFAFFSSGLDGSPELEDSRGLESFLADLPDNDGDDDPEDPYAGSTQDRVRHALRWWL